MADMCRQPANLTSRTGTMLPSPGGCLDREGDFATCTPPEVAKLRDRGSHILSLLTASGKLTSRKVYPYGGTDGGFVHTCLGHADALRKNGPFSRMSIDGRSLSQAIADWYADDLGERDHWTMPCTLSSTPPVQCNPTCKAAWAGPTPMPAPRPAAAPQQSVEQSAPRVESRQTAGRSTSNVQVRLAIGAALVQMTLAAIALAQKALQSVPLL